MNGKEDLEGLIRRHVLLGKRSPKGYEVVKCTTCNDYKLRGGFKFEAGGVHYSCFNCSVSVGYDPSRSRNSINKPMKEVLIAFGIPEAEIDGVCATNFFKEQPAKIVGQSSSPSKLDLPNKEVALPTGSVSILDDTNDWAIVARTYLEGRGLPIKEHDYLVTDDKSCLGRVIIPYHFRGKVIYWQARSLDSSIDPRYKNPVMEKDNIFFNMDELYRYTDEPLFVTEGPLDALSIGKNAIALTGSTLSEFRFRELRKVASRRKVVFVIDKNLNGYKLGKKILEQNDLNWCITCFPDNLDDANEALLKYGRLWLLSHITSTASSGFQGRLLLELKCSKR